MTNLARKLALSASMGLLMLATGAARAEHSIKFNWCHQWRGSTICSITVKGTIDPGEGAELEQALAGTRGSVVSLSGPGGSLAEGIAMGRAMRKAGATASVSNDVCASACAIAVLGAADVAAYGPAILILHSAYLADDPSHADGTAAAIEGAYLAELGFTTEEIARLIGHSPDDVAVMTLTSAGCRQGVTQCWKIANVTGHAIQPH